MTQCFYFTFRNGKLVRYQGKTIWDAIMAYWDDVRKGP